MAKIQIYTSPFCGFCFRAKELLTSKGIAFEEIDVFSVPGARAEMTARAGGRTSVPQVFADDAYIGDCDGIHRLDAEGALDAKLGLAG
ncbi:MAG: glutaredoxin [Rhodospirillaceae bacterium]